MFEPADGFNDVDLERPNFPGKATSPKVPFVLSHTDNNTVVQVPSTINQYLRDYQRDGISFLYHCLEQQKGGILADDMGLGKTVQVIGFMAAVLRKTGTKYDIFGKYSSLYNKDEIDDDREKGVFLIVSPHSVLYNWQEELASWGYFKIGKFHKNKRDETLENVLNRKLEVVLTTYETLRNHWQSLNQIEWSALIMDEVQHLKDPKAAVTIAAKSFTVKCRIGLTGTPLQNRFSEFWCVLDWANPGCLGDQDTFTARYCKPIMQGQRFDVNKRELATGRKKGQEFQSIIDEWCLRRTKSLICDQLPKKDQRIVFCPLSKLQEDIYKALLQTPDVHLVLKQSEPCDCRSEKTRGHCCYSENQDGYTMRQLTLQYLKLLLKTSNHAALLLPQIKQTDEQRKRAEALCEKIFSIHPTFEEASKLPSIEMFSDDNFCGKMKVLDKLLKLFQSQGDKVLIFSYSTQLLDILEAYVISCGMVYRRLDGRTRGDHRLAVVKEFNTISDIFLFLVSTKAGGVGLNLTSANIVIVFDPSWNPADDLQAEDRAYRIGQRKDVKVFRLISTGTIEENMYLRQVYKQQLANVAVEGNNERRYFTAVEGERDRKGELFGIENLFAFRKDGCMSSDIFARSDTVEKGFKMAKYELQPDQNFKDAVRRSAPDEDGEDINRYGLRDVASQFVDNACYSEQPQNEHNLGGIETGPSSAGYTKVKNVARKMSKETCKNINRTSETTLYKKGQPQAGDSAINKILVDCGVQHAHSNKSIVGSSKAENQMSKQAMKEVFQLEQCSQQPANCYTGNESDGNESDDFGVLTSDGDTLTENIIDCPHGVGTSNLNQRKESDEKHFFHKTFGTSTSVLVGKTPKTIRLQQFSELSTLHGRESETDFAEFVLSRTLSEQKGLLTKYYENKRFPVAVPSPAQTDKKRRLRFTNKEKNIPKSKVKTYSKRKCRRKDSEIEATRMEGFFNKCPVVAKNRKNLKADAAMKSTEHSSDNLQFTNSVVTGGKVADSREKYDNDDNSPSFLDSFLDDCSKQTRQRNLFSNKHSREKNNTHTCRRNTNDPPGKQVTSVIDDLI